MSAEAQIQSVADESQMTIVEHLEELRDRLIVIGVALVISTAFSFLFTDRLIAILERPVPEGQMIIAIHPVEALISWFKVALIAGIALSMPVILYEVVRYLLPGLTSQEKRYLVILVPGGTLCFMMGLAFANFLMLPAAVPFLQSIMHDTVTQQWTIENYISFVTTILFWMGVIFELPLVMFFLGKLRVVSTAKLVKFFRYWVVLASVIAAIVTPTPDPVNMMIVMVPLLLLYAVGIVLVKLSGA